MVHSNKALQNQGFLLCFWDVSVRNGSMSQAAMARLRRIRAEISKHDSVQRYREEVGCFKTNRNYRNTLR